MLLGSATPSLESWQRADAGRYRRLACPRASAAARCREVRLVDMNRSRKARGAPPALSPPLVAAIAGSASRAASRAWCS